MPLSMLKSSLKATLSVNGEDQSGCLHARYRAPTVINVDMVSKLDPSPSDSGVVSRCSLVKPLKLRFCKPIFGRKAIGKMRACCYHHDNESGYHKEIVVETKLQKPCDPKRKKRQIARKT